jgi:hypothetical protein
MKKLILPVHLRLNSLSILGLCAVCAAGSAVAQTVLVESRKADGSANSPAWTELSGTWGKSKNKSKAESAPELAATNSAVCTATNPAPAFKLAPEGLKAGTAYEVEVTFGTSGSQPESEDLVVAVSATGVTQSTLPATTTAFQNANAHKWTALGRITPATDAPTLTFKYVSGTLSKTPPARWYADAVRFVPEGADSRAETKGGSKTPAKAKSKTNEN